MSLTCRACLDKGQENYFSLLSVWPEFGDKSVLDMLNIITSLQVTYSENLPREICWTCLKTLKSSYRFILLFNNTQIILNEEIKSNQQDYADINNETSLCENFECEDINSIKEETDLDQNLDFEDAEEIIIVNEDENSGVDLVPVNVQQNGSIEKCYPKIKGIMRKNMYNKQKNCNDIITLSIDDVLKQKTKRKNSRKLQVPIDIIQPNKNIEEHQDLSTLNDTVTTEKNLTKNINPIKLVSLKDICNTEKREITEEDPDFTVDVQEMQENQDNGINNITMISIEDVLNMEKRKNSQENQDLTVEIQRMEENRNKNVNNIKLVSIEDVLNMEKRIESSVTTPNPKKTSNMYDLGYFLCDICNKSYETRKKLWWHKLKIHNLEWKERNLKKVKCHICGLQCRSMGGYKYHMARHENQKHSCDQCEKSYSLISTLKEHIKNVHENKLENKFLCTVCGRGFKYKYAFKYHMNKHLNSKDYVCRYCGRTFLALHGLKRHERTHTGERPYTCKYCQQTFAGTAEKRKHEMKHGGVFQFHCKYCKKGFYRKDHLTIHLLSHGGSFCCEMCNKNFADDEILKYHYTRAHKVVEKTENTNLDKLLEGYNEEEVYLNVFI